MINPLPSLPPLPDWPMFGLAEDVRPAMAERQARSEAFALATIVALEEGGPRPVGTQMVVSASGMSGFLSGGCLEGDVAAHAAAVIADGEPRRLVYGRGSPWPDIRLLCGARIEILLERIDAQDPALLALLDTWRHRRPAVWISDGRQRVCTAEAPFPQAWPGAFRQDLQPSLRLAVMGADPTALAIAALGVQAGFETTLVRPRGPADAPPIPGLAYRREDPATALAAVGLDPWTAVAVASHETELDHEALVAALESEASYVGVLGARRRVDERLHRLRAAGVSPQRLARLRAPIGLDLGGKAPFEIAIAVLGEIIAQRSAAPAGGYDSRASGRTWAVSPAFAAGA